jgi:hypothetical protein
MAAYPILCYTRVCTADATVKIAAVWSDGLTQELKTYSLCCPNCVTLQFQQAIRRQAACRLEKGESLSVPRIYELSRGVSGASLPRRVDLELLANPPS